jgi:hypothetical protein
VTFIIDSTGEIEETTMIGLCALRRKRPARFVWRGFAAARILRVTILNSTAAGF